MLLNLLVILMASTYWFYTGHSIPAFIGFTMLLTLYSEKLYFTTLVLSAVVVVSVIYYFWSDYVAYKAGEGVMQVGTGVLYMLVVLIKAKSVFDNDSFSLD